MGAIGYRKTSHAHTQGFQKEMLVTRDNMYNLELSSTSFCKERKKKKKRRRRGTKVSRPDFCHEFCKMIFTEIGVKVCL